VVGKEMNIYEVAKRAGVSIATVSRVLNKSTSVRAKFINKNTWGYLK